MNRSSTDDILHSTHHAAPSNPNRIQKAINTPSPPTATNSTVNPRSCVTCRRRKVKCDKKHPCSNCVRTRIECIYPGPGRAPRKPRKPIDSELVERLRKLEGVVQSLGVNVPPEELLGGYGEKKAKKNSVVDLRGDNADHEPPLKNAYLEPVKSEGILTPGPTSNPLPSPPPPSTDPGQHPNESTQDELERKFGRLVVENDKGKSRYVNQNFWASMSQEVEDLKTLLDDSTDEEADIYSPEDSMNTPADHQSFLFGWQSSQNVNMLALHPPAEHIPIYWKLYCENVDPLLKVMHIPTETPKIMKAKEDLHAISRSQEVLLFAIYYAATTSLWPEECRERFGEEKLDLLKRYRFGVEQGLARANFLDTDEWVTAQAFLIFVVCLRRNDNAKMIWTLTGLLVRIAQSLGLHRDGTHYGLSPFRIEMRRRAWWQVCILDIRASEDHGCDPTIMDQLYDTEIPCNVNDDELWLEMKEMPKPRTGCTEMTFGLIRFEISSTLRRLQYSTTGCTRGTEIPNAPLEQKVQWVRELHQRLEDRYLANCDMNVPLYWVITTVSRLIMSKMWLMIYHPQQRLDGGASLPQHIKDKLFTTSLENLEYSILLETEEKTRKWSWLFRTYVQWHAIAFLLSELRFRTKGPLVDRAWRAIQFQLERKREEDVHAGPTNRSALKSHLWRPMKKLMAVARKAREAELRKEKQAKAAQQAANFQLDSSRLDPFDPIMSGDTFNGNTSGFGSGFGNGFDGSVVNNMGDDIWSDAAIFATGQPVEPLNNKLSYDLPMTEDAGMNMDDNNDNAGPVSIDSNVNGVLADQPSMMNTNIAGFDWMKHVTSSPTNANNAQIPYNQDMNNTINASQPTNGYNPLNFLSGSPLFQRDQTGSTDSSNPGNPRNPRESVDWESWDNLVQEFGMAVDAQNQAAVGQMPMAGMDGKINPGLDRDGSAAAAQVGAVADTGNNGDGFGIGQTGPWPYGSTFGGLAQWY